MRIRSHVIIKNYEIEERRKAKGYTQDDFADIIGVGKHVFQKIESLQLKPTEEVARSIALELNVDIDTLFPQGYEKITDVVRYHGPIEL